MGRTCFAAQGCEKSLGGIASVRRHRQAHGTRQKNRCASLQILVHRTPVSFPGQPPLRDWLCYPAHTDIRRKSTDCLFSSPAPLARGIVQLMMLDLFRFLPVLFSEALRLLPPKPCLIISGISSVNGILNSSGDAIKSPGALPVQQDQPDKHADAHNCQ